METSLIPPNRFGALLIGSRMQRDLTLVDVARASGGRFTPKMLEDIERGRIGIDDATAKLIAEIYELHDDRTDSSDNRLVLDLPKGIVGVGNQALTFDEPTADAALERYVSLLYVMREERPGRRLVLRDADLDVLSVSLDRTQERLAEELWSLMGDSATEERTSRLSRRLMFTSAGLLLAVSGGGASLVLLGGDQAEPVASSSPASVVQDHASTPSTSGGPAIRLASWSPDSGSVQAQPSIASPHASDDHGAVHSHGDDVAHGEAIGVKTAEAVGAAAISLLDIDLGQLLDGWTISFEGDNPQFGGLTNSVERTITVYVDSESTPERVARILMHEVGHAIDVDYLDDAKRIEWIELRGMPRTWWAGSSEADFEVGAGDFAEAVAVASTGSESLSRFGDFSPEQLEFVRSLLP